MKNRELIGLLERLPPDVDVFTLDMIGTFIPENAYRLEIVGVSYVNPTMNDRKFNPNAVPVIIINNP